MAKKTSNRGGKRVGSGRKKKPISMKKIVGSSRNRKKEDGKKKSVTIEKFKSPAPPSRLTKEQKAMWRRLCTQIKEYSLPNKKDLADFEILVKAHAEMEWLEKKLKDEKAFPLGSIGRSRVSAELNAHRNHIKSIHSMYGLNPHGEVQVQTVTVRTSPLDSLRK